jgi:hypothetical protein
MRFDARAVERTHAVWERPQSGCHDGRSEMETPAAARPGGRNSTYA